MEKLRPVAAENLKKVHYLLRQAGVQNVQQFTYHTAHMKLAAITAAKMRGEKNDEKNVTRHKRRNP